MKLRLKEKIKTKRTITIKLSESDAAALFDELYDIDPIVNLGENRPALYELLGELGRVVRSF